MSILERIQKEREDGKRKDKEILDLSICSSCGKKMINNTFMHGSRLGGSYDCSCGNKIIF